MHFHLFCSCINLQTIALYLVDDLFLHLRGICPLFRCQGFASRSRKKVRHMVGAWKRKFGHDIWRAWWWTWALNGTGVGLPDWQADDGIPTHWRLVSLITLVVITIASGGLEVACSELEGCDTLARGHMG